jgi:PAS domain S-box-containing protein
MTQPLDPEGPPPALAPGESSLGDEALRRRDQEFRTLADNIPAMVARFDPELRHLFVNRQVERLTGRSLSEFVGRTNRELRAGPDQVLTEGEARLRHVFDTGRETSLEFSLAERQFEAWFGPEFSTSGRIETVLCITRDVTEQKRLEHELRARMAELAEADRRKDEFLATLAHELRNPLAPLRNGVEVLRRTRDATLSTRTLEMMERQLGQLVHLVDDLLDLARATSGKLQLRLQPVQLAAVVESAVEVARPLLDGRTHQLTVRLPEAPVELDGDPTRLAQAISNLLTNAATYTDPGGNILLTAERHADRLSIAVRDDGIGIAPEHLPRLFRMFSQVSPPLDRAQAGVGIGLALVKALVELHGGTVHAESEGPGRGSTFRIELPLRPRPAARSIPVLEPRPTPDPPRVLVIDDNIDSADSVAALLELEGAEVRVAYAGQSALVMGAAFRPTLVLLDLGMPGMNGYEVARALRGEPWGHDVFLVAMTGWGQQEDRRRTREAGFDAHLVKPARADELLALLGRRRPSA